MVNVELANYLIGMSRGSTFYAEKQASNYPRALSLITSTTLAQKGLVETDSVRTCFTPGIIHSFQLGSGQNRHVKKVKEGVTNDKNKLQPTCTHG